MQSFFITLLVPSLGTAADAIYCFLCCSSIQAWQYNSWKLSSGFGTHGFLCYHRWSAWEKWPFNNQSNSYPVLDRDAFRPSYCNSMPDCLIHSSPWDLWWISRPQSSSVSTGRNVCRAQVACSWSVCESLWKTRSAVLSNSSFNWHGHVHYSTQPVSFFFKILKPVVKDIIPCLIPFTC